MIQGQLQRVPFRLNPGRGTGLAECKHRHIIERLFQILITRNSNFNRETLIQFTIKLSFLRENEIITTGTEGYDIRGRGVSMKLKQWQKPRRIFFHIRENQIYNYRALTIRQN